MKNILSTLLGSKLLSTAFAAAKKLAHMAVMVNIICTSILLTYNHTAFSANKTTPVIVVLGDSLSAAYGINIDQGWVTLLQQQITSKGYDYRVVNASVSGDTTRNGLSRIDSALKIHQPEILIIALGGNDGLRGLAFSEIETSLADIIERSQSNKTEILLVSVRLPPNYGPVFNKKFADLYQRLALRYNIALVPKMLDQVAENRELMQSDGTHPTAEAQPLVMKNIWLALKPLLRKDSVNHNEIIKELKY